MCRTSKTVYHPRKFETVRIIFREVKVRARYICGREHVYRKKPWGTSFFKYHFIEISIKK